MKIISTAFLAAGLVALSACGGGGEENSAANNISTEDYNLSADGLTSDNLLGNEGLGNDTGLDNLTANTGDAGNTTGNSTGNTQ
jgi:hypothetical protein